MKNGTHERRMLIETRESTWLQCNRRINEINYYASEICVGARATVQLVLGTGRKTGAGMARLQELPNTEQERWLFVTRRGRTVDTARREHCEQPIAFRDASEAALTLDAPKEDAR